jgi:hypothetical protein
MIDTRFFPPNAAIDRSYSNWAVKPRALPRFVTRRTTGAIVRFPATSLLGVAMVLFGIGAVGLMVLAVLLTTRFPTGLGAGY